MFPSINYDVEVFMELKHANLKNLKPLLFTQLSVKPSSGNRHHFKLFGNELSPTYDELNPEVTIGQFIEEVKSLLGEATEEKSHRSLYENEAPTWWYELWHQKNTEARVVAGMMVLENSYFDEWLLEFVMNDSAAAIFKLTYRDRIFDEKVITA